MDRIRATKLWTRTLGAIGGSAEESRFRSLLVQTFESFRNRVKTLSNEIALDLKQLTVHDISHIDTLWETADLVIGDNYPVTPTEAFVIGGAFLLHDLGLALASYPNGINELKQHEQWSDAVASILRNELERAPRIEDIKSPSAKVESLAIERVLRLRHAEQAEQLGLRTFQHTPRDPAYHLIEHTELREKYGRLMGRIAYSHWWSMKQLLDDNHLNRAIGASPSGPGSWLVHPLKLAIILRVADACHIDSRRAPGFLRALRKPSGTAELHWRIQEYLEKPHITDNRLVFTSTKLVPPTDKEAWWVGFDLIQIADKELRDAEAALSRSNLPPFAVHGVAGGTSPIDFARFVPPEGWMPVDTSIRSSDVASLVRTIGGEGMYGKNPTAPLRELIQNARDAVVAARLKSGRNASWGKITVRLSQFDGEDCLEIEDTGVGMSDELLSGPLLDFGQSYWTSQLCSNEHPGLFAKGFEPQGKYGIGFFSVFMIGDHVKVISRRADDSIQQTRVLEFNNGLHARPIVRLATLNEQRDSPGTCVKVYLRRRPDEPDGLLVPGGHLLQTNHYGLNLDGARARIRSNWRMADLCAWLCPAMDVDLVVDDRGAVETAVRASDWLTISARDLFRRLMLHREDCDDLLSSKALSNVISNVRSIKDQDGVVVGRVALTNWTTSYPTPDGDYFRPPGVTTAGCFRASASETFPGILLGRPNSASRNAASAVAFDNRESIADWATEQANLVRGLTNDPIELLELAGLVRILNGNTGHLPIAEYEGRIVSFRDITGMTDLPNEIELCDANWLMQKHSGVVLFASQPGKIGVGSGRFRSGYDGPEPTLDYRNRADHPRWRQYWMSLWGATIEAVTEACGCRLIDVLNASEVLAKGHEEIEQCGTKIHKRLNDTLRRPA